MVTRLADLVVRVPRRRREVSPSGVRRRAGRGAGQLPAHDRDGGPEHHRFVVFSPRLTMVTVKVSTVWAQRTRRPAYPPSAHTKAIVVHRSRSKAGSGCAPSRSCTEAAVTITVSTRPRVSTARCRLRPLILSAEARHAPLDAEGRPCQAIARVAGYGR
jgi:hypothetical protein